MGLSVNPAPTNGDRLGTFLVLGFQGTESSERFKAGVLVDV